jgi:hypothetical protein
VYSRRSFEPIFALKLKLETLPFIPDPNFFVCFKKILYPIKHQTAPSILVYDITVLYAVLLKYRYSTVHNIIFILFLQNDCSNAYYSTVQYSSIVLSVHNYEYAPIERILVVFRVSTVVVLRVASYY